MSLIIRKNYSESCVLTRADVNIVGREKQPQELNTLCLSLTLQKHIFLNYFELALFAFQSFFPL